MRIGNLEDIDRTKNAMPVLENLSNQSKKKKLKNWWYYYKWYVLCGIVILGAVIHFTGNAFGLWEKKPDLQIAYVGKSELPPETLSSLKQEFTSLISDFNNDGQVIVQINQYVDGLQDSDLNSTHYEYASEITLIGDISDCDSYLFLMEDPALFQQKYQLLAAPDGSCPQDTDYSVEDKIITWSGSPALYLGRRCFPTDKSTDYTEQCNELWNTLCNNQKEIEK